MTGYSVSHYPEKIYCVVWTRLKVKKGGSQNKKHLFGINAKKGACSFLLVVDCYFPLFQPKKYYLTDPTVILSSDGNNF